MIIIHRLYSLNMFEVWVVIVRRFWKKTNAGAILVLFVYVSRKKADEYYAPLGHNILVFHSAWMWTTTKIVPSAA